MGGWPSVANLSLSCHLPPPLPPPAASALFPAGLRGLLNPSWIRLHLSASSDGG